MTDLPDPTIDLDWGYWNGAIHEVFAKNVSKHPDRTCVTETAPWRQFTYLQIHEASNVIAHQLVNSGVVRSDVVMTYAHRNVDLVIAIMGILKAGATFSVLDPLYPDDRQIIYLDVSRPRALIVIGKAKGEGLSEKVAEWIAENLELKVTLPKLVLQDDGSVLGGERKGSKDDVLLQAQAFKSHMPDVVVGPDSVPTLSFTSGSEGKPKGVLGRHFSLVYYFPWMAERFGLSENDRFTMLSGIAHDPIQRDIFTPLFLGAQILIPSQEDIQYERLAEWMKEQKCTVTHLTPAMGQILVGGAVTQFPDLKNAFFVGDILIKRDVRRLQELAPNVRTVNMLGTTETQRAVSYFAIPSKNDEPKFLETLGDKIPAGKGMKNVQLLVVDRENPTRICNVGESGEIYVRAAGLAEGYLGLEEYTKEKFVNNWLLPDPEKWTKEDQKSQHTNGASPPWRKFYKGPRDRMYRTGDLGHYTSNGNVECTGRADNQVKVRGFRIELGDIDSNLAQNPLVRENVTLLRRDKNEEHRLVSYIVPEIKHWNEWLKERPQHQQMNGDTNDTSPRAMLQRFAPLRAELRSYLKTKLADYAVPDIIIPIQKFPLNPNGKIDKPALPFPDPQDLQASLSQRDTIDPSTLTPTERTLSQIFASILPGNLPATTIGPNDSFFDLGGESLKAQTLLFQIRKTWSGIKLPMRTIFDNRTLSSLASALDRALDPSKPALHEENPDQYYSKHAETLAKELFSQTFSSLVSTPEKLTILLTGSTGFLGSFILTSLLTTHAPKIAKIILPIRASSPSAALSRIQQTLTAYTHWSPSYASLLECLPADLDKPQLGLNDTTWSHLQTSVDIIIHNGARVHWVYSYSTLCGSNVLSTLALLNLCSSSPVTTTTNSNPASKPKPKHLTFISSTAALSHPHYIDLSNKLTSTTNGIPESDTLAASASGLTTGYGQTKWTSEYLVRAAGARGLSSSIVRPGYVLGDRATATTVTDDFLVRLLKGCVQLNARPQIDNTLNATPVDYVARAIAATSLPSTSTSSSSTKILNITPHPRLTISSFLSVLSLLNYPVPQVPYRTWADNLESYVRSSSSNTTSNNTNANQHQQKEEHALLPLLDYCTADLPSETLPIALDDRTTRAALELPYLRDSNTVDATGNGKEDNADADADASAVTLHMVAHYISYLVAVGFMPAPPARINGNSDEVSADAAKTTELPQVVLSEDKKAALAGLTGRGKAGAGGVGEETKG